MTARKINAIILAAGLSKRMQGGTKLLAPLGGIPLIRHSVATLGNAAFEEVIVVIGHGAKAVTEALEDLPVTIVKNPYFAHGQASSIKAGMEAIAKNSDDILIALGDMPLVPKTLITQLCLMHTENSAADSSITLPLCDGQRRNPVIFGKALFPALDKLEGDEGARQIMRDHEASITELDWPDHTVFMDADTPQMLATLRERFDTH